MPYTLASLCFYPLHHAVYSLSCWIVSSLNPRTCIICLYIPLCPCTQYKCLVWGGVLNTQSTGTIFISMILRALPPPLNDSTPGKEKMTYLTHEFGKRIWVCSTQHPPPSILSLRNQPPIVNLYSHWILISSWPPRKFGAGSFQQRRPQALGRDASLIQGRVNKPIGQINPCPTI